jgi:hypothetical protein
MTNVVNEIKNWHLFTEKFGEEYQEPFQRGMIWLEDPNQTADSGKTMYRT